MNKKAFDDLAQALLDIDNKKVMSDFIYALLTEKERNDIPARLQIIKLLKQNVPQREIAKKLGVGIATITRGSKELKQGYFKNV